MDRPTNNTPQLSTLNRLSQDLTTRTQQTNSSLAQLRDNVANSILNLDISQIEQAATEFISEELTRNGLLTQVDQSNKTTLQLLEQINFIGGVSSLASGFFSSSFSSSDQAKWTQIANSLDSIYDPQKGSLKQAQDYFLFRLERQRILNFLNQTNLSFEEELFVRSILIKGYLANLRQLILPFYDLDDELLAKYKQERLEQLRSQDASDSSEIQLLEQQIQQAELQSLVRQEQQNQSQGRLSTLTNQIGCLGTRINIASATLGTFETTRYITSFIGHVTNVNTLKAVGNFGLKAGNIFAKFIPVLSAFTEMGTQMANNKVVFDYEKKLKILSIVDNTKRNLLILEQQVNDYYLNNVLTRLQNVLMERQLHTQELVINTCDQQLLLNNQSLIDQGIEAVKVEYYQNISSVKQGVEDKFNVEISKKDEIINDRENRLAEMDEEIIQTKNELISKRKELDSLILEKQKELYLLDKSIESLKENLEQSRKLYESEKTSRITAQKALERSLSGDLTTNLQLEYAQSIARNSELNDALMLISDQKFKLERDLIATQGQLSINIDKLQSDKENLEALNEQLSTKLSQIKREKLEIDDKYRRLDTQHAAKMAGYLILEAAREELIRDKAEEISKCNRYRDQITDLTIKITELNNVATNYAKLEKEQQKTRQSLDRAVTSERTLQTKLTELTLAKQVADQQITQLKGQVWDNQKANWSGRASGLIASTVEYIPFIPTSWCTYIKTVSQYETARGLFLTTGLIILAMWIPIYELLRWGFKKIMTWWLIKDSQEKDKQFAEIKELCSGNKKKDSPSKKSINHDKK